MSYIDKEKLCQARKKEDGKESAQSCDTPRGRNAASKLPDQEGAAINDQKEKRIWGGEGEKSCSIDKSRKIAFTEKGEVRTTRNNGSCREKRLQKRKKEKKKACQRIKEKRRAVFDVEKKKRIAGEEKSTFAQSIKCDLVF